VLNICKIDLYKMGNLFSCSFVGDAGVTGELLLASGEEWRFSGGQKK
jgi:hypothetical protein